MKTLQKHIISQYSSLYSTDNESVTILDVLYVIKNGLYESKITSCRNHLKNNNLAIFRQIKCSLPAVTFSGLFDKAHKSANLLSYSNMIVVDIDDLNSLKLQDIKDSIANDKHVISVWISPSGKGLKVLIPVSSSLEEHKTCFDVLVGYFLQLYNISIDKSGSDICRLCLYSYDEHIVIKTQYEAFNYRLYSSYTTISPDYSNSTKDFVISEKYSNGDKSAYHDPKNRNKPSDRHTISAIIRYLKGRKLSITHSHERWYRVALAIANTFTYEIGSKYYIALCELDGEMHDDYKSRQLLDYCYRNRRLSSVNFATIIYFASLHGFKLRRGTFKGKLY